MNNNKRPPIEWVIAISTLVTTVLMGWITIHFVIKFW